MDTATEAAIDASGAATPCDSACGTSSASGSCPCSCLCPCPCPCLCSAHDRRHSRLEAYECTCCRLSPGIEMAASMAGMHMELDALGRHLPDRRSGVAHSARTSSTPAAAAPATASAHSQPTSRSRSPSRMRGVKLLPPARQASQSSNSSSSSSSSSEHERQHSPDPPVGRPRIGEVDLLRTIALVYLQIGDWRRRF